MGASSGEVSALTAKPLKHPTLNPDGTIAIPSDQYIQLVNASLGLKALEAFGVGYNWTHYYEAMRERQWVTLSMLQGTE